MSWGGEGGEGSEPRSYQLEIHERCFPVATGHVSARVCVCAYCVPPPPCHPPQPPPTTYSYWPDLCDPPQARPSAAAAAHSTAIPWQAQKKSVLETFWVGPNSLFTMLKVRVRCDSRRLKNRLLGSIKTAGWALPSSLFVIFCPVWFF